MSILYLLLIAEYFSLIDMIFSNAIFEWNVKIIGKSNLETELNFTGNLYLHLLTVTLIMWVGRCLHSSSSSCNDKNKIGNLFWMDEGFPGSFLFGSDYAEAL